MLHHIYQTRLDFGTLEFLQDLFSGINFRERTQEKPNWRSMNHPSSDEIQGSPTAFGRLMCHDLYPSLCIYRSPWNLGWYTRTYLYCPVISCSSLLEFFLVYPLRIPSEEGRFALFPSSRLYFHYSIKAWFDGLIISIIRNIWVRIICVSPHEFPLGPASLLDRFWQTCIFRLFGAALPL